MTWLSARPHTPIPLADIPVSPYALLCDATRQAVMDDARVIAWFGRLAADGVELVAILTGEEPGSLRLGRAILPEAFPSLTPHVPQLHAFERELAEQFGVHPEGHPALHPLRFHPSWRPGHDAWHRPVDPRPVVGVMPFQRVEGDGIHEVAVGPVHAGVIEPGHFRFQCYGEVVWRVEISLGYQHRGIERAIVEGPWRRVAHVLEAAAGDTTIGHMVAHAQVVEALTGMTVSPRAQAWRDLALGLERLANHTGDLGALAGDAGYLPTAAYCGRLRGDWLNMMAQLCGSRFGRSLVRPGGVAFDLNDAGRQSMEQRIATSWQETQEAVGLMWSTPGVLARLEAVGVVDTAVARSLGLVGLAARASGLPRDVRSEFSTADATEWTADVGETGDVEARARIRWVDAERTVPQLLAILTAPGPDDASLTTQRLVHAQQVPVLPAETLTVALVEGWRGEIAHVAISDAAGRLGRYKVIDPSFHNWAGLAVAMRGQQISDFPLCNKSFNLSYCGHDL